MKSPANTAQRWILYGLVIACIVLAARLAERHPLRVDVSSARINSVPEAAASALATLDRVTVEVYTSPLAVQRAQAERLLAPYRDHSPAIDVVYIDPVAEPDRARSAGIAQHGEMHLRVGERHEAVRQPSAATLEAALVRLARRGERWIVLLQGHGERPIDESPSGIARFAAAVESRGYRVVAIDPRQVDQLPDNAAVVLVVDPRQDYATHVLSLLAAHVDNGGALWWMAGDMPATDDVLALPADTLPGRVVDAAAARFGLESPDNAIITTYPELFGTTIAEHAVLRRARALAWHERAGWRLLGRLQSGPQSWNETGDMRGQIRRDPDRGEQAGPLDLLLVTEHDGRNPADGSARVVVGGDANWLSNDELGRAANRELAIALVNWLSGNERLAVGQAASDLDITWSPRLGAALAIGLTVVMPAIYLAIGLWYRMRRRKA